MGCTLVRSVPEEFVILHDISSETLENWYRRTPGQMGVFKYRWLLTRPIVVLLRALVFTGRLPKIPKINIITINTIISDSIAFLCVWYKVE